MNWALAVVLSLWLNGQPHGLVANALSNPRPSLSTSSSKKALERRAFFQSAIATGTLLLDPLVSSAAVTDETDNFADNWWSSKTGSTSDTSSNNNQLNAPQSAPSATSTESPNQSAVASSDEVVIRVSKSDLQNGGGLGLELAEVEFRTNLRVFVKSVRPGSVASRNGIQPNWVVIGLNGQSTERTNAEGVAILLSKAVKDPRGGNEIEFRFRDPSVFRQTLSNLQEGQSVTTQVAPAGDTTQRNTDGSVQSGRRVTSQTDQKVTVAQLEAPKLCRRGATTDDLLEISYVGRVLETGQIFDGSAVKINGEGIAGRGNDVTLYFVLGKQPFGQFPPGWE